VTVQLRTLSREAFIAEYVRRATVQAQRDAEHFYDAHESGVWPDHPLHKAERDRNLRELAQEQGPA